MYLKFMLSTIMLLAVILIIVACENGTEPEASVPVLTTTDVSGITSSSASAGGNITSDGGAEVTVRGVCWSTNSTPSLTDSLTTDGTGTGSFTSTIIGLTANTTYSVSAYATNSAGTGYGNTVTFTTSTSSAGDGTVVDIDGNIYPIVQIGTQVWMAENFRGLHTANGSLLTGVYVYNDSESYAATYGRLYTWEAALSANPEGWHLPMDTEWDILATFLGADAGTQLKVGGSSGFNAPLGGIRPYQGGYSLLDEWGMFWTATYSGFDHATVINLFPDQTDLVVSGAEVIEAISVRYVRDN